MSYTVTLSRSGERDFDHLPAAMGDRMAATLRGLVENPRPQGCKALKGTLRGSFRVRVGDWRVTYRVDDSDRTVVVTEIGHRNRIYDRARRRSELD